MQFARHAGGIVRCTCAVSLLFATSCATPVIPVDYAGVGGVTMAMWDHLDDTRCHEVVASCLTPVTVSIDAAILACEVCAFVGGCGGR